MRGVRLAAAGLSLALVAGCTSGPQRQPGVAAPAGQASPSASEPGGSPTSSSSASPDPGPTGVNAPGQCRADQLTGDIEQYERPGQAGASQLARLGLTNVGARCTMSGYVGLQLLAANGQPRETGVTHVGGPAELVTLDPGRTAWALIVWMFTPSPDEEDTVPLCGPRPTAALVTPPGASGTVRITEDFGTVCRHGAVDTNAVSLTRPV